MSLKAMVWVLENSEAKLGDRLVLLALADHADDDGQDAYPSVATMAQKAGLSERQVQRCLANLKDAGRIVDRGVSPYGTRRYTIWMQEGGDILSGVTSATENVSDMSPEPSFEPSLSVEDPEDSLLTAKTPRPLPRARVGGASQWTMGKVGGKPVKRDEYELGLRILGFWNIMARQDLTSDEWVRMIIRRVREHPELGPQEHAEIIERALAEPWWDGHPSPNVVYGNGAQFERCLTAARNGPAPPKRNGHRRFGRGVTTAELKELAHELREAGR